MKLRVAVSVGAMFLAGCSTASRRARRDDHRGHGHDGRSCDHDDGQADSDGDDKSFGPAAHYDCEGKHNEEALCAEGGFGTGRDLLAEDADPSGLLSAAWRHRFSCLQVHIRPDGPCEDRADGCWLLQRRGEPEGQPALRF